MKCACECNYDSHKKTKISDGTGGRIENDLQQCENWETCGCKGYDPQVREDTEEQ